MTDTIITVQGHHSAWYPAERATVRASVSCEGPRRDPVFASAVAASDSLRALIANDFDKDAGPITWWTSDAIRVWTSRPWNSQGKQLDAVYHAAVEFTAKFRDFDALARWVEAAAGITGVSLESIEWNLTEATKVAAAAEVRTRAVEDAVEKATTFAEAVGLASVTALALADPGMLGDPGSGGGVPSHAFASARMAAAAMGSGGEAQLEFKPENIAVASTVDARFIAS